MEWKTYKPRWFMTKSRVYYTSCISIIIIVIIIIFSSILVLNISTRTSSYSDHIHYSSSAKAGSSIQEFKMNMGKVNSIRSLLSGPGSSPPRCTSKCGRCTPCRPVHVPVPPGTSVPTEYYPEAWRCKCGNKVYMP